MNSYKINKIKQGIIFSTFCPIGFTPFYTIIRLLQTFGPSELEREDVKSFVFWKIVQKERVMETE